MPGSKSRKVSRENWASPTPVLPQVMAKRNDHGTHSEVYIACGFQTSHARINEGIACFAISPCVEIMLISCFCEVVVSSVNMFKLHTVLHLKFLNKMVMPSQTTSKGSHVSFPTKILLVKRGLKHLPNRKVPIH